MKLEQTQTPRTDAAEFRAKRSSTGEPVVVVESSFARELENARFRIEDLRERAMRAEDERDFFFAALRRIVNAYQKDNWRDVTEAIQEAKTKSPKLTGPI